MTDNSHSSVDIPQRAKGSLSVGDIAFNKDYIVAGQHLMLEFSILEAFIVLMETDMIGLTIFDNIRNNVLYIRK